MRIHEINCVGGRNYKRACQYLSIYHEVLNETGHDLMFLFNPKVSRKLIKTNSKSFLRKPLKAHVKRQTERGYKNINQNFSSI